VGGFGGVAGLADYLVRERVGALVDATHAFAAQISAHAVAAADRTGTPLLRLARSPWLPLADDRWLEVDSMPAAAEALGPAARRVFLSIGRQEVAVFEAAPQHDYLIRAVDAFDPALPHAHVIAKRGPFRFEAERALLEREQIQVIVSKNSGTAATYAKIEAARALQLPVIMVKQPMLAAAKEAPTLDAICNWLGQLAGRQAAANRSA
jgi:precorrin-6A/cobalt-precorrin-6A reductase